MGMLSAIAMSDEAMGISLEAQLEWHLQANHYPPVPASMVPVCIEAIDAYNEGEHDQLIKLPEFTHYKGQPKAPAWAIIEAHHLTPWIIESELY